MGDIKNEHKGIRMTKDEALKMALEAIEYVHDTGDTQTFDMCYAKPALAAIKEALAQPEQEPVAWADHGVVNWIADKQFKHASLLYTTPPQRTWVGLTNKEFAEILCDDRWQGRPELMMLQVQAKLKEKNT